MSAKSSHNILQQSRVVGAPSVLWLRTGGKLVYERQGLLGSHLGSWYAKMLALVMTTRFGIFPLGRGRLAWTEKAGRGWSGKKGQENKRPQIRRDILNLISAAGAQILPGPLAASDRGKPTRNQAL